MIEIKEEKIEGMSEKVEEMLMIGGELMRDIEEMCDEGSMGERMGSRMGMRGGRYGGRYGNRYDDDEEMFGERRGRRGGRY